MKSTLSSRLHLATWIVAALITILQLIGGKPIEQFTGNVIAALFWMAVYYLFYLYVAPGFLMKRKFVEFFGISLLIVTLLPFIGYPLLFLSRALFKGDFSDFFNGYSVAMHLSGLKAMALAGVYGSFFRLIAEHFDK